MGKSRSSRHKVFSEEKKDRKDKQLSNKINELELENARLKREIEDLKASGKVVVKKQKPVPAKIRPPTVEELEQKRKEALEKVKKWRIENLGVYEEE